MEHLKKGDTILFKLGNSCMSGFVLYNGQRSYYLPVDRKITNIAYKSNKIWNVAECCKAMYGGDNVRMVLIEKVNEIFG